MIGSRQVLEVVAAAAAFVFEERHRSILMRMAVDRGLGDLGTWGLG